MDCTENIERYPNGRISYVEIIVTISPMWIALYPARRIAEDGTSWIRIGKNQKFNPDGSLRWALEYDEFGKIANEKEN